MRITLEQISTSEQRRVTKAKYFASFLFMNWKLEPDLELADEVN